MPQITFEYTDNSLGDIDWDKLIKEVHENVATIINTDISACKSRVVCHSKYFIGLGDPKQSFLHCNLAILSGRTPAQCESLGNKIYTLLQDKTTSDTLQISVHIVEMDKNLYFK